MWDWFINFLANVLQHFANFAGDWGVAIIILTVIMRLLVMPLMTKSTASSARMQALQPKMKEIQERYADDPERQAEEMRKFYSENKFNPLGGCLPILIQMPVFFALFTVARDFVPSDAHFLNIIPSLSTSAASAFGQFGIAGSWIYILFDVAFGVLTLIPMVMNFANTSEEQRQQSLIMGVVMAVMMLWFGWGVPAAVLLYYDTSAVWQVIQQKVVTQRVMDKVKAGVAAKEAAQSVKVDVVRKERKPRPHKKG
ncbi:MULTISPECIES: YidC/Oxa1 family membrane protein insertase [Atopobiaceae]|uniref:Membrane protein insertase YidC n=1 Tax=Parafannyhessea umbonata TaxID=604330 RepID=A0A1H9PZN3_9ACTN|nr:MULTISPECIES: YidC/Oxa1 family membrane protein insertase [Atopobiaceae]SEH47920.1 YidC/Oxa1 family membrane protein insertase [Parafannyhessea umbonata]SER53642.1 YidC/Oxa1 family membrane protein insertase [Parafannyhessea umbonata]SJZ68586.1 YidC/Oxa1 family membrane protein insertase [Olsenella sp. KH1P3]